ncbi:hypothetical protein SLEP1_g50233 [Rubroshorea leprosula]|nr:hypothetical protein SLEP1_g50233 [Rubroshorea leprosula]
MRSSKENRQKFKERLTWKNSRSSPAITEAPICKFEISPDLLSFCPPAAGIAGVNTSFSCGPVEAPCNSSRRHLFIPPAPALLVEHFW